MRSIVVFFLFCTSALSSGSYRVETGIEGLFSPTYASQLKGKRVGLLTNHTGVNHQLESTLDIIKLNQRIYQYTLAALFSPEHGLDGSGYAEEKIENSLDPNGIPVYSLHGAVKRPTGAMLKDLDLIIYDIQDIGSRTYTYATTLFYLMEEAAKNNVGIIVLDRPNPINGHTIDGPVLEEKWRSFVGYLNIPYCHAMTIGELAAYFNSEYKVGCTLTVVPMKGWRRFMSFSDTDLPWIPTSPNIPEATTAYFYPATGILGELQIVNIGVGYSLPFKVVGAPWIRAEEFAKKLNDQRYPGVAFKPIHFKPFFGRYAKEVCHGVLIVLTEPSRFLPVTTEYLIIGMLKSLYPKEFCNALAASKHRYEMFNKVNGTEQALAIIEREPYIIWPLRRLHEKERELFIKRRKPYLIYN